MAAAAGDADKVVSSAAWTADGNNGLERLVVTDSASGSKVEIYRYGATLTSCKLKGKDEVFFVSEKAVFDGKKAIRGGVPVVFPQFGPGKLPNHGFARTSLWDIQSSSDGAVVLTLSPTAETRALWPHEFRLVYRIKVSASLLLTTLRVEHPVLEGSGAAEPYKFCALLHSYHMVPEEGFASMRVRGLQGPYQDKTRDMAVLEHPKGEGGEGGDEDGGGEGADLAMEEETDRVYAGFWGRAGEGAQLEVGPVGSASGGEEGALVAAVRARGLLFPSLDAPEREAKSDEGLDVVVWNPWVAKAARMEDFGDDEYKSMVCVEPGRVSAPVELAPGQAYELRQTIEWVRT